MNEETNARRTHPTVALIGLGTMGAGIAERLLEQGFAVGVWNRTPGPASRLAERGAKVHARSRRLPAQTSC
jgi:3-hydroxyisobutyrate dehydrogenase